MDEWSAIILVFYIMLLSEELSDQILGQEEYDNSHEEWDHGRDRLMCRVDIEVAEIPESTPEQYDTNSDPECLSAFHPFFEGGIVMSVE